MRHELSVDINIATSLYAQARQLLLFQSHGSFWNRLRFVNKCLMLFGEINGKFRENYMRISDCRVPSILKTVPGAGYVDTVYDKIVSHNEETTTLNEEMTL